MPEASEQLGSQDPEQQIAQEVASEKVNSLHLSRKELAPRRA